MSSSERKVWQSPELLDKLLSYLDVSSTLHLAQAHAFTIQVLLEQVHQEDLPIPRQRRQAIEGSS